MTTQRPVHSRALFFAHGMRAHNHFWVNLSHQPLKDRAMPIHIGSKYTGKHQGHADTTGVYWEALPKIEDDALCIQRAMLSKPRAPTRMQTLIQRMTAPRYSLPTLVGTTK